MNKIDLQYVTWQEGKYFVSQCLNVDVSSFWKTRDQSIQNLNEAVALYFEDIENKNKYNVLKNPQILETTFAYA